MRNYHSDGVTPSVFVSLALAVLLLPLRWLLAAAAAAAFHECCHLVAVKLFGGKVTRLAVGTGGAVMEASGMNKARELCCVLAGPIGSLLLLLWAKWIPAVAVCVLIQSCYNLLPLEPLDGGRALRCIASLTLPPRAAELFCCWVRWLCTGGIIVAALVGTLLLKLGIFPILLALTILIRTHGAKTPCKPGL